MDLNLRLIHARDFLCISPEGKVDLKTSKELLLRLAFKNAEPNQYDILIDIRHTAGHLSFADIAELVEVMVEHRELFRSKLAILARPGRWIDNAKFMELYANNRGFQVRAFENFEDTIYWLMTSTELPFEGNIS